MTAKKPDISGPETVEPPRGLAGRDAREQRWQRVVGWILSPLHIVLFVVILLVFHLPLVIASKLFGQAAFDRVLQLMNLALLTNMRLAGTRIKFEKRGEIPTTGPVIYVANHQSMYDIPFLVWYLRSRMPRFIAKVELQRFLPSVSFSLRHGNYLLIDRNSPKDALGLIRNHADKVREQQETVCIFPEGTRARDGALKYFKPAGLATLIERVPEATIIPICIDGSWKLVRHRLLPIPFGVTIHLRILESLKITEGVDPERVVEEIEARITAELCQIRGSVIANSVIANSVIANSNNTGERT